MIILVNKSFSNMEHFSTFNKDYSKMKRSINVKGVFVLKMYLCMNILVYVNMCASIILYLHIYKSPNVIFLVFIHLETSALNHKQPKRRRFIAQRKKYKIVKISKDGSTPGLEPKSKHKPI